MSSKLNAIERDARVMRLSEQLIEIEQRLIPTGLHVFGRAAELQEKADLLRMVASFDRPEYGAKALPKLVAASLGVTGYEELRQESALSEPVKLVDEIVEEAVSRFCAEGSEAATNWLQTKAGVKSEDSSPTFSLLARIGEQLDSNCELESL